VFTIGRIGALDLLGRWDEALETAAAAEPYATTEFQRGLLLWAAAIHIRRGEPSLARELVDRHVSIGRSGNTEFATGFAGIEALVFAAEARYDEAYQSALRTLPDEVEAAWWLYFEVAEVAVHLPDDAPARTLLARVEDAARGKRWRVVDAQLARLRARFPEHDAVAELEAAERMFRDLEMPFYVAVVQAERAEHLRAAGRADEAEQLLAEAHEVFERLGAAPYLARGRERAVA
jgi:hypothetical protein